MLPKEWNEHREGLLTTGLTRLAFTSIFNCQICRLFSFCKINTLSFNCSFVDFIITWESCCKRSAKSVKVTCLNWSLWLERGRYGLCFHYQKTHRHTTESWITSERPGIIKSKLMCHLFFSCYWVETYWHVWSTSKWTCQQSHKWSNYSHNWGKYR